MSHSIQGWQDLLDEAELIVMNNADITFDYPKPLFPNVISVEGISVKEAMPLSKGNFFTSIGYIIAGWGVTK